MPSMSKTFGSGKKYMIVLQDPYERGDVEAVVGPFNSKPEAEAALKDLLARGLHEDSVDGTSIVPILTGEEVLKLPGLGVDEED